MSAEKKNSIWSLLTAWGPRFKLFSSLLTVPCPSLLHSLPLSLSFSLSLSVSPPPPVRNSTGKEWVFTKHSSTSWVVQKGRDYKRRGWVGRERHLAPALWIPHSSPRGVAPLPANLYHQQPGGQQVPWELSFQSFLETGPSCTSVTKDVPGCVKRLFHLTVLKLPFICAFHFYLIKEQMLYNKSPLGD